MRRSYRRLRGTCLIGSEARVSPSGLASCRSSVVNASMSSEASNARFRRPTVTCLRMPAPRAGRCLLVAAATQREWVPATLPASPLAAVVVARPARAARLERLPNSPRISRSVRSPSGPARSRRRQRHHAHEEVARDLRGGCRIDGRRKPGRHVQAVVRVTSRRPDEQDQRNGDDGDHGLEGQPQPPVVAEVVAARAHHQQVRLMTDRRQKRSRGADRDGHEEGVG